MTYCKNCNKTFDVGMNFCPLCGNNLQGKFICSQCDKEVDEKFKFCPYCGNDMSAYTSNKNNIVKNEDEIVADVDDIVDEGEIVCKIGDLKFVYPKYIEDIIWIRNICKYYSGELEKKYESCFSEYGDIATFLCNDCRVKDKDYVLLVMHNIIDKLITRGYYNVDFDNIINKFGSKIFEEWDHYCDNISETYDKIDDWVESEKNRRSYRKESRSKLIGGGFGLAGAAKGIIKAGAVNMVTGGAHSLVNFCGNIRTDSKADDLRKELYIVSSKKLPEILGRSMFDVGMAIEIFIFGDGYLSKETDIIKMNKKIEQGLINEKDILPILLKNIEEIPFVASSYELLLKLIPEHPFEIINMASKFRYALYRDDWSEWDFVDEFEKQHSIIGVPITDEEAYFQTVELEKKVLEEFHKICAGHEISTFLNDEFKFNAEEIEEKLKANIVKCEEEYYKQIESDINAILEYIREQSLDKNKLNYYKCGMYIELITSSLNSLKDKVFDIHQEMLEFKEQKHQEMLELEEYKRQKAKYVDENDAEAFFELDQDNIDCLAAGKKYLDGEEVIANIDIALAYFIKGVQAEQYNCAFELGYIYSGQMPKVAMDVDIKKLKFWMKLASNEKVTAASNCLLQNNEYLENISDIELSEALTGSELEGNFCSYVVPLYLEFSRLKKRLNYLSWGGIDEIYDLDEPDIDYYAMAKKLDGLTSVKGSKEAAYGYYVKGALNNDYKCQYYLALSYATDTASIDQVKALKYWMIRAAENGDENAKKYLSQNDNYFSKIEEITEDEALQRISFSQISVNAVIKQYKLKNRTGRTIVFSDENSRLFTKLVDFINDDTYLKGDYYLLGNMNSDKLFNAIESYGYIAQIKSKEVFILLDKTVFGSGRDGFIVTGTGVISSDCKRFIDFNDIRKVYIEKSKVYLDTNLETLLFLDCISKQDARFLLYILNKLLGGRLDYDGNKEYKNIIQLYF